MQTIKKLLSQQSQHLLYQFSTKFLVMSSPATSFCNSKVTYVITFKIISIDLNDDVKTKFDNNSLSVNVRFAEKSFLINFGDDEDVGANNETVEKPSVNQSFVTKLSWKLLRRVTKAEVIRKFSKMKQVTPFQETLKGRRSHIKKNVQLKCVN